MPTGRKKKQCPPFRCLIAATQPALISEVLHWGVFKYLV